ERKKKDREDEEAEFLRDVRGAYAATEAQWARLSSIKGKGPFALFLAYETDQVNGVVSGVLQNNWLGGLTGADPRGVFASVKNFFYTGPRWLLGQHPIFFVCFFALFLIIWAIFGGAIARIAAVHVAREEKISMRQALHFSTSKFLSFV